MATLLMRAAEGANADKKRRARKGKNAQKKQPQRGLGVAQLEKLRLEEQSLQCSSTSYALQLCSPTDHPLPRCDSDSVAQSIRSLNGLQPGPSARDGTPVSHLTLGKLSCTQGLPLHDNNVDAKKVASRALACLSSSSKFSRNSTYFPTVLSSQGHSQAPCMQKEDERRAGLGDSTKSPGVYLIPTTIHRVKESVHVSEGSFQFQQVMKDMGGIPRPDSRYFEALLAGTGDSNASHLDRKRVALLVEFSADSPKELSSFQSYPSGQAWPSPEQAAGRKRPWLAIQETARSLDLNAPAGEHDAGPQERQGSANHLPENQIGAHYTTGIVRNALGNSFAKVKTSSSLSPWQESESSTSVNGHSELGMNADSVIRSKQPTSTGKDSSSASSYLALKPGLFDHKNAATTQSMREPASSTFLTLGISSSPNSDKSWMETEECVADINRLKQSSTINCTEASTSRKPYFQQDFCSEVEGGKLFASDYRSKTAGCPNEAGLSMIQASSSKIACKSSIMKTGNVRSLEDEYLDLRLKLTL